MTAAENITAAAPSPLVAYRGLWDKFARPSSLDAVRRSYMRGVPSLVRGVLGATHLSTVLALASDPNVNRRRQPLYLVVDGQPSAALEGVSHASWLEVFAIDASGPADTTRPIYRWRDGVWVLVGCYVPVAAARRGLAPEDVGGHASPRSPILFESINVIDDLSIASRLGGMDDAGVAASLRALVGPSAQVVRVSDLVELDLLADRVREAA